MDADTKLYAHPPAAKSDIYEAYKTWPADIRAKLSLHDLRRMNGWTPAAKPDAVAPSLNELSGNSGQLPDAVAGLVEKWRFEHGRNYSTAIDGTVTPEMRNHARSVMQTLAYCADELAAALATKPAKGGEG